MHSKGLWPFLRKLLATYAKLGSSSCFFTLRSIQLQSSVADSRGEGGEGMEVKHSGEKCSLRSGLSGICTSIINCSSAQENLKKGIQPTNCGFDGRIPIVCCPSQFDSLTTARNESGEAASFWCGEFLHSCISNPPPIVGGMDADGDEFPHMAAIGYGNESSISWLCGGSLISEKFVLTAAHCIYSQAEGLAQWVRLGASNLEDELRGDMKNSSLGQTHPVLRIIRHPEYKPPSKYNDVALLEIGPALEPSSLPLTSRNIHPACLQVDDDSHLTHAVATGWGRLGAYDDLSVILQKVDLHILNRSICNVAFKDTINNTATLSNGIDESLICAGDLSGGKDTCQGDSGGPLQISLFGDKCLYTIVGITSFGKVCGVKTPGVYARVSHYISWIESIVWT